MQLKTLKEIIKKKEKRSEFAIVTNLTTGNSEIFEKGKSLSKDFEKFTDQINTFYQSKKNGIIEKTDIFVESYIRPIKVIIVGAVHIAQYLVDFANSLNFEISIIDPRGYFASKQRFPRMTIINKWPEEAFKEIETDSNTALIALTHDPKIDDPALQHALKNNFVFEPCILLDWPAARRIAEITFIYYMFQQQAEQLLIGLFRVQIFLLILFR
jgi:xanthine dehydrogenase accessory factor